MEHANWWIIAQIVIGAMSTTACGFVGYLLKGYMDLRESHASLKSRVDADGRNTSNRLNDIKDDLDSISAKLDRLIEKRP